MPVRIFDSARALGAAAAHDAAVLIQNGIRRRGLARLIFSAANSQLEMVASLTPHPGIEWGAVEIFHVDEWLGMAASHPASFAGWIRTNIAARVQPLRIHYLAGDAGDVAAECRRCAALLAAAPIDVSFLGIGENGHLGFNDPHEADFADPELVRAVTLDRRCRLQQFEEGHWPGLDSVPGQGLTLTCPALVGADHIICSVPDRRKAEAVRDALEGPLSTACPASLLRTQPQARLYLDLESASLLSAPGRPGSL
ncbi:MAG: 6-phosphogluconolactonase [Acidobacteria bacterium]|nr:6-phosphogluconolactonase [Acidobacteriota bacterium]